MPNSDLAQQRLHNQHLAGTPFESPVDVVRWLGAVQSQDYAGGKWALGLRSRGLTDAQIEQAFTDGAILRTHVMRPTWHFVTPADIRWLLELTAPRVHAASAYYYRQLELDDALFKRSQAVLATALHGGQQLTRSELGSVLGQAGIATDDLLRLGYILIRAELDGLICSGARRGKQFTYALIDDRTPGAKTLPREDALAELTLRYFNSHGPATVKDYSWWSGLSVGDSKAGLDMVKSQLVQEVIDGQTYWLAASGPAATASAPTVYLLPNYDEYSVGYTDRSALLDGRDAQKLDSRSSVLLSYIIVIDGHIAGTWKRTFKKGAVVIESSLFRPLNDAESQAFDAAARRYAEFLEMRLLLAR
jgi:hypothetical protein